MRYGIFNIEVIQAAIKVAKQEGLLVSLDLASFEVQVFLFQCKSFEQWIWPVFALKQVEFIHLTYFLGEVVMTQDDVISP